MKKFLILLVLRVTLNKKIKLNYDFNIDQNYKEINYNELGTTINFDPIEFSFNYLQENKHIGAQDLGDQEYFKTKIGFQIIRMDWLLLKLNVI